MWKMLEFIFMDSLNELHGVFKIKYLKYLIFLL